jgi:hypothetical protein
MGRLALLLSAALCAGGCVERKFVIEAYPIGDPATNIPAQVLRNGRPIGFTPVDDSFVYYGKYEFTLIRDGYETLHVVEDIKPPWYQYPLIDFFAENVWPFKISDVRRLRIPMQPLRPVHSEEVLSRAQELRQQGRLIGEPAAPAAPAATIAPPVGGGVPAARQN